MIESIIGSQWQAQSRQVQQVPSQDTQDPEAAHSAAAAEEAAKIAERTSTSASVSATTQPVAGETVGALVSTQEAEGTTGATKASKPDSPMAAIARKYDVTNISPREIDEMVDELAAAGAPLRDTMMLATHGAKFRTGIQKSLYEAGITPLAPDSPEFQASMDRPYDFLDSTKGQRKIAADSGEPTAEWDRQIAFLEKMVALRAEAA